MMFTGIVVAAGRVKALAPQGKGVRIVLSSPTVARKAKVGDSVALNGCCLTAVSVKRPLLSFQAVPETLMRTNLGDLEPGSQVNLELPLGVSDRFGGHMVQGHVDGQGVLAGLERSGLGWTLEVRITKGLTRYVVEKGSIALDGISLTVAGIRGALVTVAVIPHTWEVTNLRHRKAGDRINVEVDMLAKHIEKMVAPYLKRVRKGMV
jgi:riboflavin synthase